MSFYCLNCGSPNHAAMDCTKPKAANVAPPQETGYDKPESVAETAAEPAPEVKPGSVFEPGPPRFKGCPPICEMENLPSFETEAAAAAFQEQNSPGLDMGKKWVCKFCGCWHFKSKSRSPNSHAKKSEDGEKVIDYTGGKSYKSKQQAAQSKLF